VAYFDGLSETILSVALVRPKPGELFDMILQTIFLCLHGGLIMWLMSIQPVCVAIRIEQNLQHVNVKLTRGCIDAIHTYVVY